MDKRQFYYGQLVTEDDLNGAFESVEQTELNLAKELHETGILVGLDVSPTSPPSTSVEVTAGAARIPSTGRRAVIDSTSTPSVTVNMDTDRYGNPVYSDLLAGEGRWAAVYITHRRDQYDARIDDNGITVWYRQDDSYELFVLIANKGNATDKDTLPRPPILPDSVKLADVWFENGSVDIDGSDIDFTYRQNYFRHEVNGNMIIANNPHAALSQLGTIVNNSFADLSNPDEPTGANDGAHMVGLGGTSSQSEWQWANSDQLDAPNSNVHDAMAKIVQDLASQDDTGHSGTDHVGTGSVSGGSGSGAISVAPGTLKQLLSTFASEIARRVQIDGEDRLSGTFHPSTDRGAELGTDALKFENIRSYYSRVYRLEFIGDYDNSSSQWAGIIHAEKGSSASGHTKFGIEGRTEVGSGSNAITSLHWRFYSNQVAMLHGPVGSAPLYIGKDTNAPYSGRVIFFANPSVENTVYNFTEYKSIQRVIDSKRVQFSRPSYGRVVNRYAYVTSSSYYMFIDITDELLPGDYLESIEVEWDPYSTAGAMRAYLRSYSFNSTSQTSHANVQSSSTARHVRTMNVNITIEKNRRYYLYITDSDGNGHLHAVRLNIRRYSLDGDYS